MVMQWISSNMTLTLNQTRSHNEWPCARSLQAQAEVEEWKPCRMHTCTLLYFNNNSSESFWFIPAFSIHWVSLPLLIHLSTFFIPGPHSTLHSPFNFRPHSFAFVAHFSIQFVHFCCSNSASWFFKKYQMWWNTVIVIMRSSDNIWWDEHCALRLKRYDDDSPLPSSFFSLKCSRSIFKFIR